MSGPTWKLEDNNHTVTVTFLTDPPIALQLDAAGVDEILRNLGEFRARMKPEIAPKHALGQKVGAIADPAWATEPDLMRGHSLLHHQGPTAGCRGRA